MRRSAACCYTLQQVIRILNIKSHSIFWRSVIYSLQPVFEHRLKRLSLFMGTFYFQNDLKLGIARHMPAYHNRADTTAV